MTPKQFLIEAKAIFIAHKWNRNGSFAADKDGKPVTPQNPNAVCLCGVGALKKQEHLMQDSDVNFTAYIAARNALYATIPEDVHFYFWNDTIASSKEEVIAKFDEAIATFKD